MFREKQEGRAMIDRYTRPEMGNIFELENKYAIWQEIEVLTCEAQAQLGQCGITPEEAQWIREHASFDTAEIAEIEAVTNHDVIAFLTNLGQHIDAQAPEGQPKPSRWVHYGMTSTDLGDTAMCYQLVQATDILIEDVRKLGQICLRRAKEEKDTICVGRTHGIHAEPMTFGMKFASWAWELKRDLDRLKSVRENVAYGAISGAIGTYSGIDPFVEEYVCEKLGLTPEPLSTQVISRDHHAYTAGVLATVASTCDRIATEIRALQRTDTLEAEEPFRTGQKGSSAMPHKRNPISSENICGCARVMRGYMATAYENVALWHERDISHSSTERIVLPDATELLDYMLTRFKGILENLVVYPETMLANIWRTRGVIFAQRVMNALIAKGLSREEAYDTVQPIAMEAWTGNKDYKTLLEASADVMGKLSQEELDGCFTLDYYFKNVDGIFARVGIQ